MHTNKTLLYFILLIVAISGCTRKKKLQGSISYSIEYKLPDSLSRYLRYLPKSAKVFFKGDSAVSIQQMSDESTTIITHKPSNFMRVLLTSSSKKYVIDYNKADQGLETPARLGYTYTAGNEIRTLAGHQALKYAITDKVNGFTTDAWFAKGVAFIPNSLTMAFDTTKGEPMEFTTNQNGMVIKTTVNEIKYEPVPVGIFSTPPGYQSLTPKQLREMPVEN